MKKNKIRKSDLYYCEADVHARHCWSLIGVSNGYYYYKCSQCDKCQREKIVYVIGGK